MSARAKRQRRTAWLLASPVLAGLAVFFAVPFAITLWYSVTFGVGGASFVGLSNYAKVFRSSAFRLAAANTLRFLLVGVPLIMVLGLPSPCFCSANSPEPSCSAACFCFPWCCPWPAWSWW